MAKVRKEKDKWEYILWQIHIKPMAKVSKEKNKWELPEGRI